MPIAQTRMIALIQAARDYQQALDSALSLVKGHLLQARQGHQSQDEAILQIALAMDERLLLKNAVLSQTIIDREARHFEKNAKGNETARRQLATKRTQAKRRYQMHDAYEAEANREWDLGLLNAPKATSSPQSLGPRAQAPQGAVAAASTVTGIATAGHIQVPDLGHFAPDDQRIITQDVAIATTPDGHQSERIHSAPSQIRCECGFVGKFEEWLAHLDPTDEDETIALDPPDSPPDNSSGTDKGTG